SQANLTHTEAQFRAQALTLSTYYLHLDLSQAADHDQKTYPVTSRIEFTTAEPDLFLDYLGAEVASITVNDSPVEVDFRDGRIYLRNLPTDQPVTVDITSSSNFSRSRQGLHRMIDAGEAKHYL